MGNEPKLEPGVRYEPESESESAYTTKPECLMADDNDNDIGNGNGNLQ